MFLKKDNADKIVEYKNNYNNKKIDLDGMPQDVLAELLWVAVERIDGTENGGEFDERDAMDLVYDKEYIIEQLFEEIEDRKKYGVYKMEGK